MALYARYNDRFRNDNLYTTYVLPQVALSGNTSNGYVASSSSVFFSDPQYEAWKAFDKDSNTFWASDEGINHEYGSLFGFYAGTTSTPILNYPVGSQTYGEWIQIQLPLDMRLTRFAITPRSGFEQNRSPEDFVIAGSNDGTTWYYINAYTGITYSASLQAFIVPPSEQTFTYFRMIINRVGGGQTGDNNTVQIAEWILLGTDTQIFNPQATYDPTVRIFDPLTLEEADNRYLERSTQTLNVKSITSTFKHRDITTPQNQVGTWIYGGTALAYRSNTDLNTGIAPNGSALFNSNTAKNIIRVEGMFVGVGGTSLVWSPDALNNYQTVSVPYLASINSICYVDKTNDFFIIGTGNLNIPTNMTSNNTPSPFVASTDCIETIPITYEPYFAFDGNNSTSWRDENSCYDGNNLGIYTGNINYFNTTNVLIGGVITNLAGNSLTIDMGGEITVSSASIRVASIYDAPEEFYILGANSSNPSAWNPLYYTNPPSFQTPIWPNTTTDVVFNLNSTTPYRYYRLFVLRTYSYQLVPSDWNNQITSFNLKTDTTVVRTQNPFTTWEPYTVFIGANASANEMVYDKLNQKLLVVGNGTNGSMFKANVPPTGWTAVPNIPTTLRTITAREQYTVGFSSGCENVPIVLQAPPGEYIRHIYVKYGRWDNTICPHPTVNPGTPAQFQFYNLPQFSGNTSVSFPPSILGDPYLNVFKHWECTFATSPQDELLLNGEMLVSADTVSGANTSVGYSNDYGETWSFYNLNTFSSVIQKITVNPIGNWLFATGIRFFQTTTPSNPSGWTLTVIPSSTNLVYSSYDSSNTDFVVSGTGTVANQNVWKITKEGSVIVADNINSPYNPTTFVKYLPPEPIQPSAVVRTSTNFSTTSQSIEGFVGTNFWHSGTNYIANLGIYSGSDFTIVSGNQYDGDWIQVQTESKVITGILFYPREDLSRNRTPTQFILAGSNDGSNWTLLLNPPQGVAGYGNTPRGYTFSNTTAYTHYRMIITVVGNNNLTSNRNSAQLRLFRLIGNESRFITGQLFTQNYRGRILFNSNNQLTVSTNATFFDSNCTLDLPKGLWLVQAKVFASVSTYTASWTLQTGIHSTIQNSQNDGIGGNTRTTTIGAQDVSQLSIIGQSAMGIYPSAGLGTRIVCPWYYLYASTTYNYNLQVEITAMRIL